MTIWSRRIPLPRVGTRSAELFTRHSNPWRTDTDDESHIRYAGSATNVSLIGPPAPRRVVRQLFLPSTWWTACPTAVSPVEHVRIVGDGVRTVENVTGRMTKGKAALTGAASGAWFGALIGLLFALFAVGPLWLWVARVKVADEVSAE